MTTTDKGKQIYENTENRLDVHKVSTTQSLILKNDTTNTGGNVLAGSSLAKQSQEIACVGDSVYCSSCKKQGLCCS